MKTQILNEENKRALLNNLSTFGLKPTEWEIISRSSKNTKLIVRSRKDKDFIFLGTVSDQQMDPIMEWRTLHLLHL
jgi:hypothetical protein